MTKTLTIAAFALLVSACYGEPDAGELFEETETPAAEPAGRSCSDKAASFAGNCSQYYGQESECEVGSGEVECSCGGAPPVSTKCVNIV